MSAVLHVLPALPARMSEPAVSMLRLLGEPELRWRARSNPVWAYAKLPALLALLADAGGRPLGRDWIAALLWPDHDGASLRRALYDLRRQLRSGPAGPQLVESSRQSLWLSAALPLDLARLRQAWQQWQAGRRDTAGAQQALALWRGEFAAGLVVEGADDFALWLMQARARWEQYALQLALGLAEHWLGQGQPRAALAVAGLAAERVLDAESARALLWRCQVAAGERLAAAQDWRRYRSLIAAQGLVPTAWLQALAARLDLVEAPAQLVPLPGHADLAEALQQALRQGGVEAAEPLLQQAEQVLAAWLRGRELPQQALLMRRALMLRLMHSPWHEAMSRLAALAEGLLCQPLGDAERLDIVQTLSTWHGWMGRGVRGEVLLRSLGETFHDASLSDAARVRYEMTLALCHSCSTGDPQRSILAARRGLKLARATQVPGCQPAFQLLIANAALNRGQPGDARTAERALAAALTHGPLQRFDLVNHHQLSAQWQLAHGSAARALAQAEEGLRMARAVPFPLQGLSCGLLAVSARLLLGEPAEPLREPLDEVVALARRIGSQGYLMNALFVRAALARRLGDAAAAQAAREEAQVIARACGVKRIRKIPPALLAEALAMP